MSGCLRFFLALLVLLLLAGAHYFQQLHFVSIVALPALVFVTVPARLWVALRGRLQFDFCYRALRSTHRAHLWQYVLRATTYVLFAICQTLAAPLTVFQPGERRALLAIFVWGPAAVLLAVELFPRKEVRRVWNAVLLLIGVFLALQLTRTFIAPLWSEKVVLQAPFRGEWIVFHGGRSSLFNHHFLHHNQRHALDLVALRNGQHVIENHEDELTAYFTFGQRLLAPAAGRVVRAVDYEPDQPIGEMDRENPVGNYVVVDIGQGKYVLLAHLMRGSVRVREGQFVRAGHFLGRCGNSGNSNPPHLHIQVQNRADWKAKDLRTFPMVFRGIEHHRWFWRWATQHGELMRNDRIRSGIARPAGDEIR